MDIFYSAELNSTLYALRNNQKRIIECIKRFNCNNNSRTGREKGEEDEQIFLLISKTGTIMG